MRIRSRLLLAVSCCAAMTVSAQNFPDKPIRLIVGPGPDVLARIVGGKMADGWGQQVVVDQRPGAGGLIAADLVSKAQPDGYTLLLTTGAYTINHTLYPKAPYNLEKDFVPVSLLASISFLVITPPSLPVKTMPELIALAKARPGTLNCAHSGPGTTAHLGCEMLKSVARIDIVSIPYKGTVPAIIDVVAGQAQLMFAVMQGGLPQVKAGKLKAVAITGKKRHPSIPDVQTISEAGYAGADFVTWNGIHIPVKTPKPIVAKLNAEFDRILKLPDVKERMFELGLDGVGGSAESFGVFVQEDIARWAKVIKEANVKAEQ
ncbi:MAG: tripartite tricarboxylate transporter substrate binding protein [Betaproteobacteria bacterium]|jgi:tripartite-type tricarboxylate transporter receptor subunit TctC